MDTNGDDEYVLGDDAPDNTTQKQGDPKKKGGSITKWLLFAIGLYIGASCLRALYLLMASFGSGQNLIAGQMSAVLIIGLTGFLAYYILKNVSKKPEKYPKQSCCIIILIIFLIYLCAGVFFAGSL